ncbi:MAG TPA: DNA-processing protein DprA [Candidatus Binataceae bacterium]|nr:DNA-processing protein DprA [Candidatus Binataceae bacterium]
MPTPDAYWLALRRVRGVGPRIARLLLEAFGAPEQIFARDERELAAAGIPRSTARNLHEFHDFDALERELCELPRIGARLLRWSDPEYPANLREIADPPPYLFIRGRLNPDANQYLAVVGARAASDAGRHMARRLGLELAAKGFTVVSGLARGIDTAAHQGALDAGGGTVAVLGCGIDVIYPAENRELADAIVAGGGALLSELPVGTPPIAENFPGRNRILSGLSLGVVVVEAAERSGSLITARTALDQNRQVFAVSGSPVSGRSRGSNRLLREGARLVECVEDVIEELAPQLVNLTPRPGIPVSGDDETRKRAASETRGAPESATVAAALALSSEESSDAKTLLNCLKDAERLHVDSIIERSGLKAQTVLRLLMDLELRGVIAQHPGKLFSLA